jgi:hypothetical protein
MAEHNETTTWPELAEGLYQMLTGRGSEIRYHFDDLEISVPASAREGAPQAPWRLNGTLRIQTSEPDHAHS